MDHIMMQAARFRGLETAEGPFCKDGKTASMKARHVRVRTRPHGFTNERHVILPADVRRLALTAAITGGLLPVALGHFPHAQGHLVQRRQGVDDFILMLCVEGGGWCRFGGRHWRLHAGQAVIVPRGLPHAYGTAKRQPWSIYWAHFGGRQAMDYLRMLSWSPAQPVLAVGNVGELSYHFEAMLDLLGSGYGPANLHALATAFAHILALMNLHRAAARPEARDRSPDIRRTVDFMRQNLGRPLRLADLARVAGLSVAHYSALFRRKYGYPPLAFFLRMKVQEAGQLLVTTDEPVRAIAARLGFEDPLYFSRLFRQVAGQAPVHYRCAHQAKPE